MAHATTGMLASGGVRAPGLGIRTFSADSPKGRSRVVSWKGSKSPMLTESLRTDQFLSHPADSRTIRDAAGEF